jgi:type IV secretory pathway TraG/TraD family ATPase VirD4
VRNVQHRHSSGPGGASPLAIWALLLGVGAVLGFDVAIHAAVKISAWRQPTWNPLALILKLATGKITWPPDAAVCLVVAAVLLLGVAVGAWLLTRRFSMGAQHPARAAHLMATKRDLHPFTAKGLAPKAKRLGVDSGPGLPIGRAVRTGLPIFADWESVQTIIAGPRRMKTTAVAVPTLLAAPGPAFCTSNKPDLYSGTRLSRERKGKIWTLDPQDVVGADATWWWNPLTYVTSDRRAQELCEAFMSAYRDPGSRPDPFFEPKGAKLVANFLRAAAVDNRPLTDCYRWATQPDDDTPALILREHGLELAASSVTGEVYSAVEQRSGVFGTAERVLAFLQDPEISRWVCASGMADGRAQLDLAAFVRSSDTLYLLSKEGPGSSAGIITALAMALCDSAETYAKTCPGGRLPVPMVGVLDEAANICRWAQLPSLYTHYGSRGIPLVTILQGWSQGVEVWGESGMNKLWSAANSKTFGGGVDEEGFLRALEQLIGEYNRVTSSPSVSRGHGPSTSSTSWQASPTSIQSVADLRALPRDLAVAFLSGAPPVMIKPLYWYENKQLKAEVEASIALYDPAITHARRQAPVDALGLSSSTPSDNPWVTR